MPAKISSSVAAKSKAAPPASYVPPAVKKVNPPKPEGPTTSVNTAVNRTAINEGISVSDARTQRAGMALAAFRQLNPDAPSSRPAASTPRTSSGAASSGGSYVAPTPGSAPAPTTETVATSAPAPPKEEAPTTSGGQGGTVTAGPSASNSGGQGRGLGRGLSKTKRDNPRAARSTSIDELKKQAAKRLGM